MSIPIVLPEIWLWNATPIQMPLRWLPLIRLLLIFVALKRLSLITTPRPFGAACVPDGSTPRKLSWTDREYVKLVQRAAATEPCAPFTVTAAFLKLPIA